MRRIEHGWRGSWRYQSRKNLNANVTNERISRIFQGSRRSIYLWSGFAFQFSRSVKLLWYNHVEGMLTDEFGGKWFRYTKEHHYAKRRFFAALRMTLCNRGLPRRKERPTLPSPNPTRKIWHNDSTLGSSIFGEG